MKPLSRIFDSPEVDRRLVTIKKRVSVGRYLCADQQGRLMTAATGNTYAVGSTVIVTAGRITGTTGNIQTIEV